MKGAWEWMQFLHKFTFHKCGKLKVDWALQNVDGVLTLALYGSTDGMDWLLNFLCAFVPIWFWRKMPVAIGWALAWQSIEKKVLEKIRATGTNELRIVAHSYGTGVAAHAGVVIYKELGIRADFIGFGAVKPVMFKATAKKYLKCFKSVTQYCHRGDFVCLCPPLPFYSRLQTTWIGKSRNFFKTGTWHNDYENSSHYEYAGNSWWRLPKVR